MFYIIWPVKENFQILQRFFFIIFLYPKFFFASKIDMSKLLIFILRIFLSIHPFSNLFSSCRIEVPVKSGDHYSLFRCIVVIVLTSFQ